jgi:uncharacterized ion transporter superfamily protein YfcC
MFNFKKSPDSLVIISGVLILFTILTWIIPAGEFLRQEVNGRMLVVPGTYQETVSAGQGIFDLLLSPFKGFKAAAEIIAFVLLVGGAFQMLTATGAIDAGLFKILEIAKKNPSSRSWIIVVLMSIFSLGGMSFGMSEETLVFVLITLPLARSMGYDAIVGVAIPFVGAGMGFAGAAFNPFTVGIAQGIAELPIFSGFEYRLLVWVGFTLIGILFTLYYAHGLDKGKFQPYWPEKSNVSAVEVIPLTFRRKVILMLFGLSLVMVMVGAVNYDWYIPEICALFVTLGILSSIVGKRGANESIESFYEGAKMLLPAALVIAMSNAVLVIATEGHIIDTMLFSLSGIMDGFPKVVSVELMFFVQGFINFFIPSGSGQAAITMPVMTPLADLLGISRQTAVLAYQFGDGLFNLIIPTSGVTMGILSIAGIPYMVWMKWIWKMFLVAVLASMIFLALPVTVFTW